MARNMEMERDYEVETNPRSLRISKESIEKRFGLRLLTKGILAETDVLPFLRRCNQVLPVLETPERTGHTTTWRFNYVRDSKTLAYVSLRDSFSLPVSKNESRRISQLLIDELDYINIEYRVGKAVPTMIPNLQERVKILSGWKLEMTYEIDRMDGWNNFTIYLEKKLKDQYARVSLDLFGGCSLDIRVPVNRDFDSTLDETRKAAQIMSSWLDLPYAPLMKYEFSMNETDEGEELAQKASTFQEYFFNVLDYWRTFVGNRELRALVGMSGDGVNPILLLEDPSLGTSRGRYAFNLRNLLFGGTSSDSVRTVSSHPDIYEIFKMGIQSRQVSQSLVRQFPNADFDDREWLHMFVHLDDDGASLIEDVSSNLGKDGLKILFPLIEKQYGVSYGGVIDKQQAEINAKEPMFMPIIATQTAIIKEKYGEVTAGKFRVIAKSALVYGNIGAQEKYESYLKLI